MKCRWRLFILLALSLSSIKTFAHGEDDKARFVAADGKDEGRCDNRFRPCQTIAYALTKANKGDAIRVAEGSYDITTPAQLVDLTNDLNPVLGGYNRLDNYQIQKPYQHITTLVGVPAEYRKVLSDKGFHVVADIKSQSFNEDYQALKANIQNTQKSHTTTVCSNGEAAGYACNNIDLVAHMALSEFGLGEANDIWGHYDINTGIEYAILGLQRGLAVISLENPESPVLVGTISGQFTDWRDIKVLQYYDNDARRWMAYAYASAERVTEGLTILDLNNLPFDVSLANRAIIDLSAHNVYISNVDYSLGVSNTTAEPRLITLGQPSFGGAMRSYSLTAKTNPQMAYVPDTVDRDNYTHDASSLTIDDARATSDCVNAVDGICQVILDFNENEIRLWDHSAADSAVQLSAVTYATAGYVHSGWWSEDKNYIFVHDEFDERDFGLNSTVYVFDMRDLNNPVQAGQFTGPTAAIDHNGFVRGNRYYMSNYERGLTILDISNPESPEEVGFFDTYPASNSNQFNGAWGAYPYLPSGLVLVSDINSGLYILKDNTREQDIGFLPPAASTADEGDSLSVDIINRFTGATSIDYQIIYGSASATDVAVQDGTLTWEAGEEAEVQTITINTVADSVDEVSENFFIKLFNPTNGATLSDSSLLELSIKGNLSNSVVLLQNNLLNVKETDGSFEIPVARWEDDSEAVSVNYRLVAEDANNTGDFVVDSGTVTWEVGETGTKIVTIELVNDDLEEGTENFIFELTSNTPGLLASEEQSRLLLIVADDDTNEAPTVDAGVDIERNTGETVTLAATATDPEASEMTFSWIQVSGAEVTLSNNDLISTSFTAPSTATTLTFEFAATDDFGVTTTDQITVEIIETAPPATTPPVTNTGGGGGSLGISLFGALILLLNRRKLRLHQQH